MNLNDRGCRNPGCDEGKYVAGSELLCLDCFYRQIGDAVKEVAALCRKAYAYGIQAGASDMLDFLTEMDKGVEVN